MTVAEKLTTIAENQQKVYDAGNAVGMAVLNYLNDYVQLFYKAVLPDGYSIVISRQDMPDALTDMLRLARGIRSVTLNIQNSTTYKASGFAYSSTTNEGGDIEEINLPENIKFSAFSNFACSNYKLQKVSGAIDLSQSTNNTSCFSNCLELVDVRFVAGTIAASIPFGSSSNLSDESVQSIIDGLMAVTEQQTLTLHSTVVNKLTTEQMTAISNKNWLVG